MSDIPFDIRARHNGRESVQFFALINDKEIHSDRYRLGDAKRRERLAKRWAADSRLCNGQSVSVQEIEQALLQKERAVRESIDRGDVEPTGVAQASLLLALVEDKGEFFHDEFNMPYATIPVNEHRETHAIQSRSFKLWLGREFYEVHGRPTNAQALNDALQTLEGEAIHGGLQRKVAVRIAAHDGAIYLDLGNPSWTSIEITASGWRLIEDAPVKFRRPAGLKAFPEPQRGGNINELRDFINVGPDEDFVLIVGFVIGCFMPTGTFPILPLNGEQGSAKSTASRVLRELTDPNAVPLRSPPRNEQDLVIAAHNSRVIGLDNVSDMPDWVSDALCRISAGGGFSVRALFTDNEEALFTGARPILLNGIGDFATRPDFLSRAIPVTLPAIDEHRRTDEATFWIRFREAQPRILGAILDAVVQALRDFPTTKLARSSRLADFSKWMVSAEPALGWPSGTFLDTLDANCANANSVALESSPVSGVLFEVLENCESWEGTATELLEALNQRAPERIQKEKSWPRTAAKLGMALRRLAPNLRTAGINLDFGGKGRGKQKRRSILITKTSQTTVPTDPLSPSPYLGPHDAPPREQLPSSEPSPQDDLGFDDFAFGNNGDGGITGEDMAPDEL